MNQLLELPIEKISEICDLLDDESLIFLSETSKDFNYACSIVIEKRKEEQLQRKINKINEQLSLYKQPNEYLFIWLSKDRKIKERFITNIIDHIGQILILPLKLVGDPIIIRQWLKSQNFNNEEIEKLIERAIILDKPYTDKLILNYLATLK